MPLSGRAAIEQRQFAKLTALLHAVIPANPFYTAKLGADFKPGSLADFAARAPFTTKSELVDDQQRNPSYGSNLTYPIERYTRYSQTSGTSGQPMRWLDTTESWDWMSGNWKRVYDAAGITPADRIFFAFSFGPFLGFWVAFDCASRIGALAIPGGGMRSAARLHAIIDAGVTALCCTPTYAIRLGETATEEGIDIGRSQVKTIIAAGEAGASIRGTREHISRLWQGARVVDHHGMTEIGPVSYGCPKRDDVLHTIEDEYIAEVLDPGTRQPVAPGGTGELVLTNLGRLGSPLLRYRTSDIVKRAAGEKCDCGSWDLALEGGILSRMDDMVVVRGVNVYPSAVEDVLRRAGVSEYRVSIRQVHAMPEMSLHVEAGESPGGLEHRLQTALSSALGLRVRVQVEPAGTLPRFEMKSKRWIFENS